MVVKVLVVDDSKFVRSQVGRALPQPEFTIVEAVDGQDALERLAQNPDVQCIVCDVNMPRLDGLQFLEALRKDARWQTVPVVMCTTEVHPELVSSAAAHGARAWVVKPFQAPVLLEAVRKHLLQVA